MLPFGLMAPDPEYYRQRAMQAVDATEYLTGYRGPEYLAFHNAPGWYVWHFELLSEVAGIMAHGYVIVSGPHDNEVAAELALQNHQYRMKYGEL